MIQLPLHNAIVVKLQFSLHLVNTVGRESRYYPVDKRIGKHTGAVHPVDELLRKPGHDSVAVDEFAQRRGIVLDQFAAEKDEALVGVAVKMLPSAPEQSGYLPRESSRNIR